MIMYDLLSEAGKTNGMLLEVLISVEHRLELALEELERIEAYQKQLPESRQKALHNGIEHIRSAQRLIEPFARKGETQG